MPEKHPNLVFVFPDEYRPQALGFLGQDPVRTPNLDRFAAQSLVLTHAVSNRPLCSPYRAMLLTGKYPHANGVLTNCNSKTRPYDNFLRESDRCLSDVLHEAGYSQGYVGKFHLDCPIEAHYPYTEGPRRNGVAWDAYTPPGPRRHGFDFWHSYGCCDWHLNPHYWVGEAKVDERIEPGKWSVEHETDVAVEYIHNPAGRHRDPDRPFSLFVSYNPPHMPFDEVPARYVDLYDGRTPEELLNRPNVRLEGYGASARKDVKGYFAAVTGVDDQFGRILRALDEEGLADDTIVVFASDHGEMMGGHARMGKVAWYDESLLTPFILRWPGRVPARRDDLLLSVPDIMPTLLEMTGLADAIPPEVQGTSRAGIFLGGEGDRPASALYLNAGPDDPAGGARGVRTHRHTFVIERLPEGGERTWLFDNEEDPFQLANVAADRPDLVERLTKETNGWLVKTGDPWLEA